MDFLLMNVKKIIIFFWMWFAATMVFFSDLENDSKDCSVKLQSLYINFVVVKTDHITNIHSLSLMLFFIL